MPAYNAAPFIAKAIESVAAQTREDWALVIVDDGSTDDTAAIVHTFLCDPRIRLIQQENAGASAARNTGVRASHTPFLSLLDADDLYEPRYIQEMIGVLEQDDKIAFCSCDAYFVTDKPAPEELCSHRVSMVPPVTLERVAAREFQVYTAASFRRDWFDRVGGYDEELRNAEDFDLWLRLLAGGGRAAYIDRPLAWYRRTPNSLSSDAVCLHSYTIRAYEKLRASRPEAETICNEMISENQYLIALANAKSALKTGDKAAFESNAQQALSLRSNPKLAAVLATAKISPSLARALFAWRA